MNLKAVLVAMIFASQTNAQSNDDVELMQEQLIHLGYDAGTVDGLWGASTRSALENFFDDRGDDFDGELDWSEINAVISAFEGSPVPTSYQIAKEGDLILIPSNVSFVRAQIDVDGDGIKEIFAATQKYDFNQTPNTAANSDFVFLRSDNGIIYREDEDLLRGEGAGCVHPRKAVVNDFNLDGMPDVFVACHGWDARPFPGERSKIVLSQNDGSYEVFDASSQVGFFHGAASADFNGDGAPDVIVVGAYSGSPIQVWLNDGTGQFNSTTRYVPQSLRNTRSYYFTVEVPDIDGDGRFDLFVGGHDWERFSDTYIFLNPGNNNFRDQNRALIPKVYGNGVVLDVVVSQENDQRLLWVLKTSGGGNTFYEGVTIQKYSLMDGTSSIAYQDLKAIPVSRILPFWRDGRMGVQSDDKSRRSVRVE